MLRTGTWVELKVESDWVRVQLTWASPHRLLFMFTQGDRTRSMTYRRLQHMLAEGSLPEAELALGLSDWVDPDTGELAEATHTRIEDH